MREKIAEFFKRIMFLRQKNARKITFLIIGSVGCGKTALIYFMYEYILREIKDSGKTLPLGDTNNTKATNELIKEMTLRDFVSSIQTETTNVGDFIGTEEGSINFIVHRMNNMVIQIYNISGEVFQQKDDNQKNLIDTLYDHMEECTVEDTYCLLCTSYSENDSDKEHSKEKDEVVVDFLKLESSAEVGKKARKIIENIRNGKNTLRVVTKFDKYHTLTKLDTEINQKNKHPFHLISRLSYKLNKLEKIKEKHSLEYRVSETDDPFGSFLGTCRSELFKYFSCTGLFSRNDPLEQIFENGTYLGESRILLKKKFRGNGLMYLGMYGVDEIINFSIKNPAYFKKLHPKTRKETISITDYKKIFGLK